MAKWKDIEATADAVSAAHSAPTSHDKMAMTIVGRLFDAIRSEFGFETNDPMFTRMTVGEIRADRRKIDEHVLLDRDGQTYLFGVEIAPAGRPAVEVHLTLTPVSVRMGDGRRVQGWDLRHNTRQLFVLTGEEPTDEHVSAAALAVTEAVKVSVANSRRKTR